MKNTGDQPSLEVVKISTDVMRLSPEIQGSIQNWSNSLWRPSIPSNLILRSVITAVEDERAKRLTAEFLYGERTGEEKEIPYDDSPISNTIGSLNNESLWLHEIRSLKIPSGFPEDSSQPEFDIPTGKTAKCSKCKGSGEVRCWACKGSGRGLPKSCPKCQRKGCRSCRGEGTIESDCPLCKGSGRRTCGKCDGYRYVQILIKVTTRFLTKKFPEVDYQGKISREKLIEVSGHVIFQEVANYPQEEMRIMLTGGINREEYRQLQAGVAGVYHSLINQKLQSYDGDISLVHGLVDNFFKKIPDAYQENRVLQREILPIRLRITVEDVPVKRVTYTYQAKTYELWVYGKEQKVFAEKRPFAVTGRLVFWWIFLLWIVGMIYYGINKPGKQYFDKITPITSTLPSETKSASVANTNL